MATMISLESKAFSFTRRHNSRMGRLAISLVVMDTERRLPSLQSSMPRFEDGYFIIIEQDLSQLEFDFFLFA